jgi:hypothetical protein
MLGMFPPIPGVHAGAQPQHDKDGAGYAVTRSDAGAQPQHDKDGAGYAVTRSDAAPRQYASTPAEISSKEMSTGAFPLYAVHLSTLRMLCRNAPAIRSWIAAPTFLGVHYLCTTESPFCILDGNPDLKLQLEEVTSHLSGL